MHDVESLADRPWQTLDMREKDDLVQFVVRAEVTRLSAEQQAEISARHLKELLDGVWDVQELNHQPVRPTAFAGFFDKSGIVELTGDWTSL